MSAIKNILLFVLGLVGALFLWSVVEIFLPHAPKIFVNIKKEFLYFDIDLRRIFSKTKPQIVTNRYDTLQNFTLKAVYQNDGRGFVVLEKNKKTYFVDLNKSINGYKLVKINQNSAVFEKNSKKYILTFKKIKTPKIYNVPDVKTIKKETLENYKRNLAKVWKEIGIIKTKNGYLVTYVKPKSIFDKLGLKKGDYILEINDIPLKSDADAWRAYNSIDNFNQIDLTIKRNYQIKVLHYEID